MLSTLRTATATMIVLVFTLSACSGDTGSSATVDRKSAETSEAEQTSPTDPREELASISGAIPIYQGAEYQPDLTRRDETMIRNRFGNDAEVFTLATDDSYPQVYHYYMTYLAQFRAFPAQTPYPRQNETWRTREVHLNEAMQDPFVPGQALDPDGRQVILQIAETENRPRTVIRYIVTPALPAPVATASTEPDSAQIPR
jgi:hypothetical protein